MQVDRLADGFRRVLCAVMPVTDPMAGRNTQT
jgi:hypothetical protein